jgi:peptide/nickel transport system substrate-binding protein
VAHMDVVWPGESVAGSRRRRHSMRSPLRARMGRFFAAAGLAAALLVPAAAPVASQETVVLRVGSGQSLDSLNPYGTALVVGYEVFLLSYDMLVGFGPNLEPREGFAESWERAADGNSWTFKIREGMSWSDGTPATAQDACFSYQLNLDAIAEEANIGLGYIDPSVTDSGITAVDCPDATTMIVTTSDPSDRVLQNYVPILPQHIWGEMTYTEIGEDPFNAPLVGTGPYQVVEWKTGEFVRFVRNENYWGQQGVADEVIIQFFGTSDTMAQALVSGDLDYARLDPAQFDQMAGQPDIVAVEGTANGWTQLGFNSYGTGTGNVIEGGGPSTPALQDAAFRDALGYAIDKPELLDRILNGHGTLGNTPVPPALTQWHTPPTNERTFDLTVAAQKLEDAGYVLDGSGQRLDKEGDPISLRLVMPDSDDTYPDVAQFIQAWWGDLGITVTPQVIDEGTLIDLMLPPEAGGEANKADYDLFIWGWGGSPDPNALLQIFLCEAIGGSSDSMWCDETYDALYAKQLTEGGDERKATLAELQQYWYDQAPYHILYYDSNLDAYRTDRIGGWQNQPGNGTPLFAYDTLGYTLLTAAAEPTAEPTAAPSDGTAPTAAPTPAPSGDGDGTTTGDNTPLLLGVGALVAIVVAGLVLMRRRSAQAEDE